ncbi:MAG: molecular chaperone Tir [Clostridia bacterium]|nr:molecular chaperone Tir [Clostridia bacterium]
MMYRTKTYIAGDWTGDSDLIQQIYKWNNSDYWGLDFHDAHELTQARDDSLPCSIKSSLRMRLDASKTFVLIVGDHTMRLTKGGCQFCNSYNSYGKYCAKGHSVDYRSYIEYECEKAIKDGLKTVVIYNAECIDKALCPDVIRHSGVHLPAIYRGTDGKRYWDYQAIKTAIMGN